MMRMITGTLLILCLLITFFSFAKSDIRFSNVKIIKYGDSLRVSFNISLPNNEIATNEKLVLQPVLYSYKGSERLRKLFLNGRVRNAIEWRKDNYKLPMPCEASDTSGQRLYPNIEGLFKQTIVMKEWMDTISLKFDCIVDRCDRYFYRDPIFVVRDVPININPVRKAQLIKELVHSEIPQIKTVRSALEIDIKETFVKPTSAFDETIKSIDVTKETSALAINFRVGVARVEEEYENNKEIIGRLLNALNAIKGDKGAKLTKLVVVGYASPDGLASKNEFVAQRRAEVLRDYLIEKADLPFEDFTIINGGEDWGGLRKMVTESDMLEKEEVLRIIDDVPVYGGREKELMDLNRGETYRMLKRAMFPKLRNAGYLLAFYDTQPDIAGQAIDVAIGLIHNERYSEALELLKHHSEDSRVAYPLGVCYLRIGDLDSATRYLKKATEKGNTYRFEAAVLLQRIGSTMDTIEKSNVEE